MSNQPHPNADILRAIADGKIVQFGQWNRDEPKTYRWHDWDRDAALSPLGFCASPWRIKPDTIDVNGITCNAPFYGGDYVVQIATIGSYGRPVARTIITFQTAPDADAFYDAVVGPLGKFKT